MGFDCVRLSDRARKRMYHIPKETARGSERDITDERGSERDMKGC